MTTLQEFMAQNPAAKTEVDSPIAKAQAEAKAEYSARVEVVKAILIRCGIPLLAMQKHGINKQARR